MPKKPKLLSDRLLNGHRLRTYMDSEGRRTFRCKTMPDLAEKYDGATDPMPCVREFERRASGGVSKADDTSKGAA